MIRRFIFCLFKNLIREEIEQAIAEKSINALDSPNVHVYDSTMENYTKQCLEDNRRKRDEQK